ncbi:MAG TPA: hypothetical protein H9878_11675 [Candidatus Dietzia merdigallinarum]|nr:hypothetical protein [Candidatus Dietzia merdigallinarum]
MSQQNPRDQAPHASGERGWQPPSVGLVLAAAGSAILVVAVGVVILLLIRGPGDDGAGADGATALGGETGTAGSSSSSLSSASTTADADAPPGVLEQCSDSGEPVLPRSGRGTDATSCAFAAAVHEAYFRTARPGDPAMVEAHSPTTGQRYEMGCIANHNNGGIICRGGDNAVVFLY